MSRPYREQTVGVQYFNPIFEAVLLARTSQRQPALLRSALAQGKMVMTATYGFPRTPFTDDVLTGMKRLHLETAVAAR
jgi:hypothetical protein